MCIRDRWEGNGHYYKLCGKSRSEHLSWTEAKQACEEMGGHLVTITSQDGVLRQIYRRLVLLERIYLE